MIDMVLDKLGSSIKDGLRKITGRTVVNKELVEEVVKDLQRALLQSDVDVKLVFELSKTIKDRALNEKPGPGITEREHVINVFYQELVKFLGEKEADIPLKKTKILLVGLFGSGKTTTAGKIAKFYQKRGLKPCLVATDTFRPAAYEQLVQIGNQIGVPVFGDPKEKDSGNVLKKFLKDVEKYEVVIVDSSGRNALDKEMIKEIKNLNQVLNPDQKILIMPADLGQQAGKQAQAFQEALNITGVIVTKMEGTAKGGGALSACKATGAPVIFIGTGEKLDQLEKYDPARFVSQLIGFGDLKGLLERAKEVGMSEEKAKKMLAGKFTLNDFYEQIENVKGMGSFSQILDMIPGFRKDKLPKELIQVQEEKMKKFRYIIDSMTPKEREEPDLIDASRVTRIAKGSGTSEEEVRELLKMYKQSRKAMKLLKGGKRGQLQQLMKQFGLR